MNTKDRARGAFFGLLIGDAFGVPYEFHDPEELPPRHLRVFTATPTTFLDDRGELRTFYRAHHGTPEGTWSDDGALTLALAEALGQRPTGSPKARTEAIADRFARNALRWRHDGDFTPDGRVFDIGGTTAEALRRFENGCRATSSGPNGIETNGNGSLMRIAPLAIAEAGLYSSTTSLFKRATSLSAVTHGHPFSTLSCALFTLVLAEVITGKEIPESLELARAELLRAGSEAFGEGLTEGPVEDFLEALDDVRVNGSGFVLATLRGALEIAAGADCYLDAVNTAIGLGLDTDTTAAVTGALAGARFGYTEINRRIVKRLQGRPFAELLFRQLFEGRVPA